jgi:hypothetical protein
MRLRFGLTLGLVLLTGSGILSLGFLSTELYLKGISFVFGAAILLPGLLLVVWLLQDKLKPAMWRTEQHRETWIVADDGQHNAFTDMIFWRDYYWLVYVSSPSHFATDKSRLVLLRSTDAQNWQETRKFDGAGQDIRDPKLGIIHDRMYLYALLNQKFDPEPYRTIVTCTNNGIDWTPFEEVTPDGWLLGRSITADGITWFAPAHRIDQGTAVLLRSTHGVNWMICSTIFEGKEERADETAIHFLKNGRMIAVTRLEAGSSVFGSEQATTLISIAAPPFTTWTQSARSDATRLDGPNLFSFDDQIYAVGRRQPRIAGLKQGSVFSQKRTALFLVKENDEGLIHLTDLPSSGDTAYAGVVITNEKVFISYYTNNPQTDYPWLLGMLLPTRIQITAIEIASISTKEEER